MQTELSRLAGRCCNESVPDAFQTFAAGISTPTKTERRIFDGYAAGQAPGRLRQLTSCTAPCAPTTRTFYDKLGVSSFKQLQFFVAILNSGSGSTSDESGPKKAR